MHQIFPLPDHPLQYRAIGIVRGKYQPSQQQFNKGTLLTSDGTVIDAVLLGRVISLVQNYLDLEQEQWWVVYPRTRIKSPHLHVQIQGVRSPQSWNPNFVEKASSALVNQPDAFSIRGEVINQEVQAGQVTVKIRRSSWKLIDRTKSFKLKLAGFLPPEAVAGFWDLHVQREGESLAIQDGQQIGRITRQKSKVKAQKAPKKN